MKYLVSISAIMYNGDILSFDGSKCNKTVDKYKQFCVFLSAK